MLLYTSITFTFSMYLLLMSSEDGILISTALEHSSKGCSQSVLKHKEWYPKHRFWVQHLNLEMPFKNSMFAE